MAMQGHNRGKFGRPTEGAVIFEPVVNIRVLNSLIVLFAVVGATVGILASIPQGAVSISAAQGLGVIGSIILFSIPFTRRGRTRPRWVRIALWIAAPIVLGWSLLGFCITFASARLSLGTNHFLYYTEAIFAGMALGILILLVVSGESFRTTSKAGDGREKRIAGESSGADL